MFTLRRVQLKAEDPWPLLDLRSTVGNTQLDGILARDPGLRWETNSPGDTLEQGCWEAEGIPALRVRAPALLEQGRKFVFSDQSANSALAPAPRSLGTGCLCASMAF